MISDQLSVVRVVGVLPAGFSKLRDEARLEGFNHVERLAYEWEQGIVRFDRPGEALLAAHDKNELAGIGGLTIDPFQSDLFRMRRLYVRPRFRREGIGHALVASLLEEAGTDIVVNAPQDAQPFWRAMGFKPDISNHYTHILRRRSEIL